MRTSYYALTVLVSGVGFGAGASWAETGSVWAHVATVVPWLLTLAVVACTALAYAALTRWMAPVAASWVLAAASLALFIVFALLSTGPGDIRSPHQWMGYGVTFALFSAPVVLAAVISGVSARFHGRLA